MIERNKTLAFRYSMKLSTMTGEVTRAQAAATGPGATLLYDDWYPALRASKITGKHTATAMLLGIPLLTPIAKFFGRRFVRQDQLTMIQQAEGLKHNPSLMLIDDADRPAKWYFELKQARLESQATGTPMRHPMSGPVTLHWRS
jgi:hypothetical protein